MRIFGFFLCSMSNSNLLYGIAVRGCLIVAILVLPVASYGQEAAPERGTPVEEGEGLIPDSQAPQKNAEEPANRHQAPTTDPEQAISAIQRQGAADSTCNDRCQSAEQRETDDPVAQQSMTEATDAQVYLTLGQILVGGLGVGLLLWTLYYTRQSTKAAIDAAAAAVKATEIAGIALTGLEKPHLFVDRVEFDQPLVRNTFDYENEERHPWVHYWVKNYGRSPAIIKEFCGQVWAGAEFPEYPEHRDSDIYGEDDSYVLAAGDSRTKRALTRFPIDGQIMNDIGSIAAQRLRFFGYIRYESLFGQTETVGFCWRYNLDLARFLQEDMPNYTYHHRGDE